MKFLYSIILAASMLGAAAQNLIRGKVFDAVTREGLPGGTILAKERRIFTVSGSSGSFTLDPPRSGDSIVVTLLGYASLKRVYLGDSVLHFAMRPASNQLNEVVVSASRDKELIANAPVALEKIDAKAILQLRPMLLTEVINKATGVVMLNLNNEQHAMSIRQPMGTSPYYLYMEDGIPLRTMGVFNHNALIEVNLFSISSIEIVKGPSSSLYGPEAVGGAINFITQKPSAFPAVRVGLLSDNFGYRRFQFSSAGPVGKKLGYTVSGYRAGQRDGWMSYSDYDKLSLNARVDYSVGKKTNLVIAGSVHDYYSQTPGSVDSTAFYSRSYQSPSPFTFRAVRAGRIRASTDHRWNNTQTSSLHLFYRNNFIGQNPAYAIKWNRGSGTASGEVNENRFTSTGIIVQHVALFPQIRTKVIAGASSDYSPVRYQSHKVDLSAKLRSDGQSVETYEVVADRPEMMLVDYQAYLLNSAAYIQTEINPLRKLIVTCGLRYDLMRFQYVNFLDQANGKKAFERTTPRIGATYKFSDRFRAYANYSQGFSPPGLTSIFTRKPGGSSAEFYYDLQAARFDSYELGSAISLLGDRIFLNGTFYEMKGSNELLNVRLPDNSTDLRSAGKTLHRGIEYSVTAGFRKDLRLKAGGSNALHRYERFEISTRPQDQVRDVNGKRMPSAPSWMMNAEIVYQPVFIKGFRISAEWFHLSSWYLNQVNTAEYDNKGLFGLHGISFMNIRVGYQWKIFDFFMNVMNLTDELYAFNATKGNTEGSNVVYTPAPPRSFVVGVQVNFIKDQKSRK